MVHSFPPVISVQPKSLILGSMPGVKSLQQQQYYAHPQNQFWWILATLFQAELSQDYGQRLSIVHDHDLALWDVLHSCQRQGSLDSAIDTATERANDIPTLLRQHPQIDRILFNGQKARLAFDRHILRTKPSVAEHCQLITLPSTSAANARMTRGQKLSAWCGALLRP